MSLKRTRTQLIFLLLVLAVSLLGSCLDIHTGLTLGRDGGMTAEITYTLDGGIADYGRGFGADDPWPFPLTERDFRQKALTVEGVEIKRYRSRTERDGSETVRVAVKAETVDAMSAFLDLPMLYESDGKSGSLRIDFPGSGIYAESTEETRRVMDSLVADSLMTFSIRTPSAPSVAGSGIIDGRNAVLELRLDDVLYGRTPDSWTVTW